MSKKENVLGEMLESLEKVVKKMATGTEEKDSGSVSDKENILNRLGRAREKTEALLELIKAEQKKENPAVPSVYIAADIGDRIFRFGGAGSITGEAFLSLMLKRDSLKFGEDFNDNF